MASADLDLCYISGTDAIAAFKAKKLSPVELLDAQIARIEAVNPKLNVLTATYFDRARDQAKQAEQVYASGNPRPLEGLTVGIKDWHSVKGEITTSGSKAFENFVPDQTAPTVERLLDAGAIMHCRTTTSELAHSGVTNTPLWGVSRNPWNPEYSPGGSSGGSGGAVAAGMTVLSDGTDGGGSIRLPASVGGLIGYKAPWGRNPLDREHPGETVLHYGPITRTVGDAALMQNVMSGPHPADLYSLRERVTIPATLDGIKGWKIAFSMDLGYFEVDHEVQKNTRAALDVFRDLGCTVEEVDIGWTPAIQEAFEVTWQSVFYALAGDLLPRWHNELTPSLVAILEAGKHHTVERYYGVQKVRFEMYQKLAPILDQYDVLICPTMAIPGLKAEHSDLDPNFTINGKKVSAFIGWIMTYPFNMVSQCPAMSVPSGFSDSTGVPTGMQIVARTFDDLRVFRAAGAFEAATQPWKKKRPNI